MRDNVLFLAKVSIFLWKEKLKKLDFPVLSKKKFDTFEKSK
jgi:hypothetical protein